MTTAYGYDAAGHLIPATVGTAVTSYTYNALDFVATISYPNGVSVAYDNAGGDTVFGTFFGSNGDLIGLYNYQYDALHRLISRSRDGQVMAQFAYDGAGQLEFEGRTGPNGYYKGYGYDAAGNRISTSR